METTLKACSRCRHWSKKDTATLATDLGLCRCDRSVSLEVTVWQFYRFVRTPTNREVLYTGPDFSCNKYQAR